MGRRAPNGLVISKRIPLELYVSRGSAAAEAALGAGVAGIGFWDRYDLRRADEVAEFVEGLPDQAVALRTRTQVA